MSFGGILRQSTAVDVLIGPFVGSDNGDDEETGLTIAQADVRLSKNGQTGAQKNDATSAAHDADGFYNCELDATDTNTVGQLTLYVHVAGALAVRHDYQVIEEAVYDISYAAAATGAVPSVTGAVGSVTGAVGSVTGAVGSIATGGIAAASFAAGAINAAAIANGAIDAATFAANAITSTVVADGAITAAKIADAAIDAATFATTAGAFYPLGIIDQGTAQSATSTTLVLRSAAAFADDEIIGATIVITGGSAGVGQARAITDNVSSTDTATVEAWTTTPTGTITYQIYGTAPGSAGGGPTAAQIADAVWEEALADHEGTVGSTAEALATAGGSGASAADIADAVWDEAQADHVSAGTFGEVATEVAAILVDTAVIGAAGAGLTAIPWNADWDAEVQSEVADALDADIPATPTAGSVNDVLNDLDARLPVSGTLATATNVSAVETDTQDIQARLPAALNNGAIIADVQRINDVEITGDGSVAPFDVA